MLRSYDVIAHISLFNINLSKTTHIMNIFLEIQNAISTAYARNNINYYNTNCVYFIDSNFSHFEIKVTFF